MTITLSKLQQSGKTRVKVRVGASGITQATTVAVVFEISRTYKGNDVVLQPGDTSGVSCADVTEQDTRGVEATASVAGVKEATVSAFLDFNANESPAGADPLTCP